MGIFSVLESISRNQCHQQRELLDGILIVRVFLDDDEQWEDDVDHGEVYEFV